MWVVFALLYAPILVLVVFSFNEGGSLSDYTGFSFRWYGELFRDSVALQSLKNSLILAVGASTLATVIGTFASLGLDRMRNRYLRGVISSVTNIPMMNPDIVTGISMMLLFVFVGTMLGLQEKLNFWTLLIAHVTFNIPYVILNVTPKLQQMDKHLPEAALDLGCTPLQAFFKVELPCIFSGIVTGFIMAFTLSLDDFVISYFCSGSDFQTLPILIYSMTKKEVTPDIYALSTLMIVAILVLLILTNISGDKEERQKIRALKKKKASMRKEAKS
jgi:spermidine/putrescine transport system permease protein